MNKIENKEAKYNLLLKQIKNIIHKEPNFVANLCNILSLLKQSFNFFWVGAYFVEETDLVLGPFQGPPACARIPKGKGVCGKSWKEEVSYLVPDVNSFPGHISCNANSKSEIVVPVKTKENKVLIKKIGSNCFHLLLSYTYFLKIFDSASPLRFHAI